MTIPSDLFSIKGKAALITGGTKGIGLMLARGLVAAGVRTAIASRSSDDCRRAEAELSRIGTCIAIPADIATAAGRTLVRETLESRFGALDILVNNAGVISEAPLEECTEESWDRTFDVNVKAGFFLVQALLPLLLKQGSAESPARIINTGSIGGLSLSSRENYAYMASKAAVHHLTKALAVQLSKRHVTVNCIAPGPFPSEMAASAPAEILAALSRQVPRGRMGTAEDIVGTVIYLASRAGAYVNAAIIPLDGGMTGALTFDRV
ncbi:SDR family oxidoreductase [Pseudomonas putida]|uniref:SDR family oxidoreductase n=1 Tax=Pseudomonas putida TaxID=303 RepID=A0A4D6XEE1_PSEPU|nr:SDR family oxidoreductase [Pseudomonas putida]QCI13110.1 SDR family oxidoreductase [Pseudomonas putida]